MYNRIAQQQQILEKSVTEKVNLTVELKKNSRELSRVSHYYDYYSTTTQDDERTPWADSLTTRVRRNGALRKCIKRDMKCTSSDVLASGQADNQLIEACGCIFIIYYRLPDAFLHIVRHS